MKTLLLICSLLLTGCAGPFTDVTKTSMGFNSPTDPNHIQIVCLPQSAKGIEVGSLITEGWGLHDVAKMHNDLRQKAATLGANSVVLLQPHYTFDSFWGIWYLGYTAVAVK